MVRRLVLIVLFSACSVSCLALSFYSGEPGTTIRRPYFNEFVKVHSESIHFDFDSTFKRAEIKCTYTFSSNETLDVPFILVKGGLGEQGTIQVTLDGIELDYSKIDINSFDSFESKYNGFKFYEESWNTAERRFIYLCTQIEPLILDHSLIFESKIERPEEVHKLEIKYLSKAHLKYGWTRTYRHIYELEDASQFSKDNMTMSIDASKFEGNITTNLKYPRNISLKGLAKWTVMFPLTQSHIEVKHKPKIPKLAQSLIYIRKYHTMTFGIILMLCHFYLIARARRHYSKLHANTITILGGLLVPLLTFVLIDEILLNVIRTIIGEHFDYRTNMSELTGLIFLIVYGPIYLLLSCGVNFILKATSS